MDKKSKYRKSKKFYTFKVSFSFDMQHTFDESEVQPAEEGDEDDLDPTDEALAALAEEIKEHLEKQYMISNIEACADFDTLLGVLEDKDFRDKQHFWKSK